MHEQSPSVAIVGIGGIFPDALELSTFWENIRGAKSAVRGVPDGRWALSADTAFDPEVGKADHVYSRRGCFIETLPTLADLGGLGVDRELASRLDPLFQLLLHAGKRAFEDSVTKLLDRARIGVIIGNLALPSEKSSAFTRSILGRSFEEKLLGAAGEEDEVEPLNRYVAGLPAGVLAAALGLGGGSFTLDAACASSLYAIKLAADELLSGRADAMLTGGVSRPDPLYTQMGFSQLRALSKRGVCSPFDASGDGLVVGEGAGIFLLKRTADAIAQGDRIYGIIKGVGLSNDVGGSLLAPMSDGQLRAMRAAYAKAGWQPQDVDLIECHATGTPVGDATEVASLKQLWSDKSERSDQSDGSACVIGSVKSNIGHLLTAAGAAALTKVLLSMAAETLPPTANFNQAPAGFELDESPFRVLTAPAPWPRRAEGVPRRAAVSAFGFGGINAHLLVEEWLPTAQAATAAPAATASPIAIVGLDARFGQWRTRASFQARALGGAPAAPAGPTDWWGSESADWLKKTNGRGIPFSGYYLDQFSLRADEFRIPPRELEEMLPQQLLMLQSAAAALADAGPITSDPLRTGVFVGIALDLNSTNFAFRWSIAEKAASWAKELGLDLSDEELEGWIAELRDCCGPALTANRTMGALGSVVASRVAREFRCGGPSFTISGEDSSGMKALEVAVRQLQTGEIDRAIVGAVDLAGDLRAALGHHLTRQLSAKGINGSFQAAADGSLLGEGAACVVLKRLEDAQKDGDRIYAALEGIGSATGELVTPGAVAYLRALKRAYREAGVEPGRIGYLEANGSGHPAEDRMEAQALAAFFTSSPATAGEPGQQVAVASVKSAIGHTGAASGLASLTRACLALYHEIIPDALSQGEPLPELSGTGALFLPKGARYWLRNRASGVRRAGVSVFGVDGNCSHAVLAAHEQQPARAARERLAPLGQGEECLFCLTGADRQELAVGLGKLSATIAASAYPDLASLSRDTLTAPETSDPDRLAVTMVARNQEELAALCAEGEKLVLRENGAADSVLHPSLRDRLFFPAQPIAQTGKIGFVYPGSGNHFPGMGMEISARWPELYRRQDAENLYLKDQFQPEQFWNGKPMEEVNDDHLAVIFGQVATGCAVTDLVQGFGIKPQAVIGYSLGESAGLFASRAWRERDLMLSRMQASTLFTRDLAGECRAAARAWGEPEGKEIHWCLGVVDVPAREVRRALKNSSHVYLLIVNTPEECVIGGDVKWVKHLVAMLDCRFFELKGVTTVHCEVARQVATPYRDLHMFNTTVPAGVSYYSGAAGHAYQLNRHSAADSILAQAIEGIDYPKVVEAAYAEGVRYFIEMGPGGSCSRMIGRILGDRPHVARSVCAPGIDVNSALLRLLAQLIAERVPVSTEPLFAATAGSQVATAARSKGLTLSFATGGGEFRPVLPQGKEREVELQAIEYIAPVMDTVVEMVAGAASTAAAAPPVVEAVAFPHPPDQPSGAGPEAAPVQGPLPVQDPLLAQFAAAQQAALEAHEAYLRVSEQLNRSLAEVLSQQIALQQQIVASGGSLDQFPASFGTLEPLPPLGSVAPASPPPVFDRAMCMEFAIGSVARMLGPAFAEADGFPTRVRLPDEPLMLVDRIVTLEGEPKSMTSGRVVTEHDVLPGAWYLDGGRIPTCVAVEAGQADLFLSGYLGIDFITRGHAVYRLLDAVVTFHRELPKPGEVIVYDIRIERFFRQNDTYLFRFNFESTVNGEPLLSMRNGCAGFFSEAELAAGKGIVKGALDQRPRSGKLPADWQELVPMEQAAYSAAQLDRLREGDLAGCFGDAFASLPMGRALTIPGGAMKLVHRVTALHPKGGRYGLGFIQAEADIRPDDWFITCHFVDDKVMPGTLMYECCLHTLRIFLLRMGWVAEADCAAWQPVPGVASQLSCRGQVLETTKVVRYEVTVRELGYRPEPYAVVDALMYSDGKPIVEITGMSVRLTGTNRERLSALWQGKDAQQPANSAPAPAAGTRKPAVYTKEQILAYSNGKPSEGFGDRYRVFDGERKIARLPGPPFQFMDRVTAVKGEPWRMVAGARAEAQYDVPADAWYFQVERQPRMPFAVLLEAALQPCGWLAAYVGSALTAPHDISFRNLGGSAVLHRAVTPDTGTITMLATLTKVATSGGMIIQEFDFSVSDRQGVVYDGNTMFGFFAKEALENQVGIRDAAPYQPTADETAHGVALPYPDAAPFPDKMLRMIDNVDLFVADGGPKGLGFLKGTKKVDPDEWFFKAHFYQDPVTPGSLGLESFLQLVKFAAVERWGWQEGDRFAVTAPGSRQRWLYRGQVVPADSEVTVTAWITAADDRVRTLTAAGFLSVDGRPIYQMNDFTLQLERG